ncbi:hypothetical protein SELMODRAFT_411496 [Selaginella moellendorffii]|uniref:Uncharacterized protein n=1 Tax=Selaginella moellendorffii TaxID=88036 RepID=D8RI46_SELML|nr:hypothetical protein SELMODRAFT_411496 [Selaginella moellendorffii]
MSEGALASSSLALDMALSKSQNILETGCVRHVEQGDFVSKWRKVLSLNIMAAIECTREARFMMAPPGLSTRTRTDDLLPPTKGEPCEQHGSKGSLYLSFENVYNAFLNEQMKVGGGSCVLITGIGRVLALAMRSGTITIVELPCENGL